MVGGIIAAFGVGSIKVHNCGASNRHSYRGFFGSERGRGLTWLGLFLIFDFFIDSVKSLCLFLLLVCMDLDFSSSSPHEPSSGPWNELHFLYLCCLVCSHLLISYFLCLVFNFELILMNFLHNPLLYRQAHLRLNWTGPIHDPPSCAL